MELELYRNYVSKTIFNYPIKYKTSLINTFINKGIASEKVQMSMDNLDSIDISKLEINEQLSLIFDQKVESLNVLEEWECKKDYKYSTLFDIDAMENVVDQILMLRVDNAQNEFHLSEEFVKPYIYEKDEKVFLKYNLKYDAIIQETQEQLLLKYPFLVVFHIKLGLVEFRFDAMRRIYFAEHEEQSIYLSLIQRAQHFIQSNFDCLLTPIDLNFIIKVAKTTENVKLIAEYILLSTGGNAQLDVGKDENCVLPFIGELKNLVSEHTNDLVKVPKLKSALEAFIFEKEELSEFPWVAVMWENDVKSRNIRAKFIFNYMSRNYCLIQHYFSNELVGMERMNYVTNFVAEHRNQDTR